MGTCLVSTLILPERIFVDVTILAISLRTSMLLGSLFKPFFHLLVCPIPFRQFFLSPPFPAPRLSELKYLPILRFLSSFELVERALPLRRLLISETANLCSGEMDLGRKSSPRMWFFQKKSTCYYWPSLSRCCPYVRIPSAGQSGSLGSSKRGF